MYARYYCQEDTGNFEHDLMIIDDPWELDYITNRTAEFQDDRDWRIGKMKIYPVDIHGTLAKDLMQDDCSKAIP